MADSLFIDQEFRALIPPLDTSELALLEESILEEGVRDAIVTWNGYIVDGHNRYNIITNHDITDYRVISKNFKDREEAKIWIKKNQIGRRNISPYLRGEYQIEIDEWKEAKRQARLSHGNRESRVNSSVTQDTKRESVVNSPQTTRVNVALAKKLKIGEQTASRIIQLHEKAPEEVKAKLRTGDISINEAYKKIKKLKSPVITESRHYDNSNQIFTGDCSLLYNLLPDDSADLFFTDPPYGKESLYLFGELAKLAQAKLKPGGLCLTYAPQPHLPAVIEYMSCHMDYWWIFSIYQTGGEARIWKNKLWVRWKPVLVFAKRPSNGRLTDTWFNDAVRGEGEDKRYHQWGQSIQEATYWIESLAPIGGMVIDPLCGGGTVPMACKLTKRQWLATEKDAETAARARQRLQEFDNNET